MNLAQFLSGIYMITFAASGVFFLKFWIASRNRFYALFSTACFLLSFERVALLLVQGMDYETRAEVAEANSYVYVIRLASFLIILYAIIDQNKIQSRKD